MAPRVIARTLGGTATQGAFIPPSSYEAYIRGELALAEGRHEEAVALLEQATAAPDEDVFLLSRLAYAQLRAGHTARAAQTLAHAATLDACSEAVWLTQGSIAESEGDLERARRAFVQATACAPRSPQGEIAQAELLSRRGEHAAALDALARAADRPLGAPAEQALWRSLADADAAALAHTFARLGSRRALDARALEQAVALALARGYPRLALRLQEISGARLPPRLAAQILRDNLLRDRLAALLAATDAEALGGAEPTAALALEARAYERAELEASGALLRGHSDSLLATRARARAALSRPLDALADARAIRDLALRRSLLLELLAQAGAPALASELAVAPPEPK